ncbi:hypothetical protein BKA80DRAFT_286375, partial [Phyllosticta citrichinensis]
ASSSSSSSSSHYSLHHLSLSLSSIIMAFRARWRCSSFRFSRLSRSRVYTKKEFLPLYETPPLLTHCPAKFKKICVFKHHHMCRTLPSSPSLPSLRLMSTLFLPTHSSPRTPFPSFAPSRGTSTRITHSYTAHCTALTTNARTLHTPKPRKKTAAPSFAYADLAMAQAPRGCVCGTEASCA